MPHAHLMAHTGHRLGCVLRAGEQPEPEQHTGLMQYIIYYIEDRGHRPVRSAKRCS
jgi:hypothetical protein